MSTIASIPRSPAAHTKAVAVPLEERGVIRDASWNLYDQLSEAIGEQSPIRLHEWINTELKPRVSAERAT
jgi:hypothetical protein